MKKWICAALAMVMLLGCAGAVAQEYVSIQEVYDQAQAMGGWWKETFETPNGEVTIDAPIIVPDVERMPVFTVEPAKPLTQELYNTIVQGKKTSKSRITIQYELEYNAVMQEFYLGREEDGKYGYDAVNVAWVQRGDYRFSQGTGVASDARPKSYHYPWELDFDQAYVRGSDQTLNDMITLWQKDIELCYPDDEYVVKPKRIYINGSVLAEIDGEGKKYQKDGDCFIYGEQYFFDFPLIGSIGSCDGENKLWVSHVSSRETNKVFDKMAKYNMGSSGECYNQNRFLSANNEDNRSMIDLNKVRSIEYEDVPLAGLKEVLSQIEKEIEAGYVKEVYAVRLGYVMYSNPDMTDYAWAIPRWVIDCSYESDEFRELKKKHGEDFSADSEIVWESRYFLQMPIDAQSGNPIIYALPTEEILRVPEIITWNEVK